MDSFWDFFWFTLSFFLLMAYLVVLFQILTDLFRDKDVSGGMKAVWVFFLIFFPIITSLVYLIARGKGMAERNVAAMQAAQADTDAGHYDAAAAKLDQALKRSPDSPELLQDRAEVAVYQHDYALAQKLAQQSWTLGPKLGPLCARNRETIAQLRQAAGDVAGAASAQKSVAECHVQGIHRY